MKSSERLRPVARVRIRTWPGLGVGMGMRRSWRTEGGPGAVITAASMVLDMLVRCTGGGLEEKEAWWV